MTEELLGFGQIIAWTGGDSDAIQRRFANALAEALPDHEPTVVDGSRGYFANLTVRDNMLLGLQPIFDPSVEARLVETARQLGLDAATVSQRPDRNQQALVCLTRAFVADPTVLLIIDPATVLADEAVSGFARLTQARRHQQSLTVLALTENDAASFAIADRVIFETPRDRLVFDDTPIGRRLAELVFTGVGHERRSTLGRMAAELSSTARSIEELSTGLVGLLSDIYPGRQIGVAIQGPNRTTAVAQAGPHGQAAHELERRLAIYPEPVELDTRFREGFELAQVGPDRHISGLVALERRVGPKIVELDESTAAIWPALAGFGARQRQELIQRDRARIDAIDALVGGIAHDLNNSLQSVVGAADIVSNSIDARGLEPTIDTLRASAADAAAFVAKLLAFSRDTGTDPEPTIIDMHQVIGDAVDIVRRGTARSLQAELELEAQSIGVLGKAPALRNVMVNLLINAAQASEDPEPQVLVSSVNTPTGSGRSQIVIDVTDHGRGISASDAARLFEPSVSRHGQSMATGLGLAVASSIVAEHRGQIELLETSTSGSTFRIQLPCCDLPDSEPALAAVDRPLGILVIDDDPLVLEVLTEMLHHQGHTCWQAPSGDLGLETLADARSEIDICIVDQLMPGLTGDQVLMKIRDQAPEVGTVWLSGHHGPRGVIDQTAADVRLSKPVDLHQLTSAVEAAHRRATLRSGRDVP